MFSDLDLGWGSPDQGKAKPFGLTFSHTFQLIRIKSYMGLKLFKLGSLTASRTFDVGMHVYEPICFQIGILTDSIELNILIPV